MARAPDLLGSCEEAAAMLFDDDITVGVNQLREVGSGVCHRLVQMTTSRSMQVEASVEKLSWSSAWAVAWFVCRSLAKDARKKGVSISPRGGVSLDCSSCTRWRTWARSLKAGS